MGLGRNEELHISCDYKGREDDCPKECSKCAISIKTDGDVALSVNKLDDAIRQYKRAIFLEPAFAEAWCNLASAYGMKSEYHNAVLAFDKALAVDPQYGKAMYGKAVTLRNLGQPDEALALVYGILQVYQSPEADQLKANLMKAGAKIKAPSVNREVLQESLRNCCSDILRSNQLLSDDGSAPIVEEIYQPEDFAKSVLAYCKKKYAAFGEQKIRSECIITSFYGAICATIFFYRDKAGITATTNYSYLNDHIDMEFTDVNAERLLGTKAGEEKAESIWELITPFIKRSNEIFRKEWELSDELILEAMKNAYKIGMLVAVREQTKINVPASLKSNVTPTPTTGQSSIYTVNDVFDLDSFIGLRIHIVLQEDKLYYYDPKRSNEIPYLKYPTNRNDIRIGLRFYDTNGMPQPCSRGLYPTSSFQVIEVTDIYGVLKYSPNNEFTYYLDDAFFIPSEKNIGNMKPLPQSEKFTYCQLPGRTIRLLNTKDSSTAEEISIPDSIGSYTVTEVGGFYGCEKLVILHVPNSVRKLLPNAFMHCPLLQKITIGAGLEELGERCFAECNDIKSFSISQDNPAFCSVSGAVISGDKKSLIRVPSALLGAYSVPEGIACISYDAFLEAEQLEEINLPASVETIENLTFGSCNSLKRISVDSKNKVFCSVDGVLLSADKKLLYSVPPARTGAFTVPEGVERIKEHAFDDSHLSEVVFSSTVEVVEEEAFWFAKSVKRISIPKSVKEIEEGALTTNGIYSFGNSSKYEPDSSLPEIVTERGTYAEQYAKENNHPLQYSVSFTPSLPPFSRNKKLSDYKTLESIELLEGSSSPDELAIAAEIIAETEDYYVYSCGEEQTYGKSIHGDPIKVVFSRCFVRQRKSNPREVVYLGGYGFESVVHLNGKLFYKSSRFWDGFDLWVIDIVSGKHDFCNWFSNKSYFRGDVGVAQDSIDSLRIENGKLLVNVIRSKSNPIVPDNNDVDPFDLSMEYTLSASVDNGKIYINRSYTDIDTSQLKIVYTAPRQKWHVATGKKLYFIIDNDKRAAKSHKGIVLQTSYIDLAKRLACDLEQYGDNPPEMTSLSLQVYMTDHIIQLPHGEVESTISTFFEKVDDWTYRIDTTNTEWDRLFGHETERKSAIEAWLSKTTHMQMNAVFALGKQYKSLNLPCVLALIIEKAPPASRSSLFNKFADFVKRNNGPTISQNDLDVFSSYYELHFKSVGPTTDCIAKEIDFETILRL